MAQETIRHLQIFRNDSYPLIGAPDAIKTRIKNLLSDNTSSGIHIKDGEFIDVRYYKGRYELNQGTPSAFVWRVLVVESNESEYIDPSVSANITRIHEHGVVTGLTGVGISINGSNQLNTSGQANDIQWLDESVATNMFNVESGSDSSDVVKVYVTENPDGNFIVTSAIDWTNLASHLTITRTHNNDEGTDTYTLYGGDDTSSLDVELASFTITPGGSVDNYVQGGQAVFGIKWANLSAADQTGWDSSKRLDVDDDGTVDYALYYSGCSIGGNIYTSEQDFITAVELGNKGAWLLRLDVGTDPSDTFPVYVSIPDFTYLVSGTVNAVTNVLTLTNDNGTTITIDISNLKNINVINGDHFGNDTSDSITGDDNYVRVQATTTTDVSTGEKSTTLLSQTRNSNVSYSGDGVTHTAANDVLTATQGLLTYASVQTIEHYIDQYDCGTYTITLS